MKISHVGEGKVVLIAGGGKVYTDMAARFCRTEKSLDEIIATPYNKKLVEAILKSNHTAAMEFDWFIFGIEGYSRVTETQLVRKRHASYLIKSGRAELHGKREFSVVLPTDEKLDTVPAMLELDLDRVNLTNKAGDIVPLREVIDRKYINENYHAEVNINNYQLLSLMESFYNNAVKAGVKEEDARYYKPQATSTKAIVGMNCYDDQTEVLTDQGWKFFEDLNGSERFYSIDPDTRMVSYIPAIHHIKKWHSGKMVKVKSRGISLVVTPEHMNLVSHDYYRNKSKFNLEPASSLFKYNKFTMLKACKGFVDYREPEFFVLPEIDNRPYKGKYYPELKIPMDEFLEFLGFYLSDGSCYSNKNKNTEKDSGTVILSKGDKSILEYFNSMVSAWLSKDSCQIYEVSDKRNKCYNLYTYSPQLFNYFHIFGTASEKFIPDFVWDLSPKLLKNLYNGFILGDGSRRGKKESFCTTSKLLADGFQRLCLHIGISATISKKEPSEIKPHLMYNGYMIKNNYPIYRISVNRKENIQQILRQRNKDAVSLIDYDGYVYCVELPELHTLYVRRNGKPVWSGNCTALNQWFRIRTCCRAQSEIRDLALKMMSLCKKAAPDLFQNAGPSCVERGFCPELEQCAERKGIVPTYEQYRKFRESDPAYKDFITNLMKY